MAKTDPMDKLREAGQGALKALGDRAMGSVTDRVGGLTDKLEGIADGGPLRKAVEKGGEEAAEGGSPVKGALKGAVSGVKDKITGGGGGSGGKEARSTNIVETIDVGVPVSVAYNLWTEFGGFPSFMKKVESVEAEEDNKLKWRAQILWSHRTWEATILEQVPDERIVWRSQGEKGHVDGAVTFHEIGPNLTRILLDLEYYPQGFFEKTGNIWEAQGRRVRAEFRHFRRHVMAHTLLEPEEVEGWRGVIEDGEVVRTHDEVVEEEEQQQEEGGEESEEEPEDEYEEPEDEPEDESDEEYDEEAEPEEEPEDEYEEPEDEPEDESDEEYDEEAEPEEEPEDEYEEPEDEPEDESDEEYDEEAEPEDEYEEPEDEPEDESDEEYDEEAEERPKKRSRRRAS